MAKKKKEETLSAASASGSTAANGAAHEAPRIENAKELKTYLESIRDRMSDASLAPIFALTAMNTLMHQSNIYDLIDQDTKEMARDIFLRLKQSGLEVMLPPLLFSEAEAAAS